MNDSKRTQRTFRPAVDALEGRLVLSSGASAAHAAHIQQLQEQRTLLREQRQERNLLLQERHTIAVQAPTGTQRVQIGTTSSSTAGRPSSSQATTPPALQVHPAPLNVGGQPTPNVQAVSLAANVVSAPAPRTTQQTTPAPFRSVTSTIPASTTNGSTTTNVSTIPGLSFTPSTNIVSSGGNVTTTGSPSGSSAVNIGSSTNTIM